MFFEDTNNCIDYYPFGSTMPGRQYTAPDSEYRFGFNGKEKDTEGMGGGGSTYDYGFRIYNPQIGKFLSVDPLSHSYPWNSSYAYAENDVIRSIDLEGLEKQFIQNFAGKYGVTNTLSESEFKASNRGAEQVSKELSSLRNHIVNSFVTGMNAIPVYKNAEIQFIHKVELSTGFDIKIAKGKMLLQVLEIKSVYNISEGNVKTSYTYMGEFGKVTTKTEGELAIGGASFFKVYGKTTETISISGLTAEVEKSVSQFGYKFDLSKKFNIKTVYEITNPDKDGNYLFPVLEATFKMDNESMDLKLGDFSTTSEAKFKTKGNAAKVEDFWYDSTDGEGSKPTGGVEDGSVMGD